MKNISAYSNQISLLTLIFYLVILKISKFLLLTLNSQGVPNCKGRERRLQFRHHAADYVRRSTMRPPFRLKPNGRVSYHGGFASHRFFSPGPIFQFRSGVDPRIAGHSGPSGPQRQVRSRRHTGSARQERQCGTNCEVLWTRRSI